MILISAHSLLCSNSSSLIVKKNLYKLLENILNSRDSLSKIREIFANTFLNKELRYTNLFLLTKNGTLTVKPLGGVFRRQTVNFQIFGIPMSGDDICGFAGNTTVELCARWMQVGSFYPFMRNHMRIGTIDQFPYSLGETVFQASMASLKLRYSILKFYYTVFVRNQGVGTVFRPVFFDYPNDTALLSLDTQFLIGSELMVAAVVEPGKDHVNVYFPVGNNWYDFASGEKVYSESETSPKNLSFTAPLNGSLPVFIKGGSLVAVQNVENVTSTKDLDNVINLVVGMRSYLAKSDLGSGNILGIGNYSDEASVDKCVGKSDCLIGVSVQTFIQGPTNVIILVAFIGSDIAVLEKEMMIGNITLYGMRTGEDDEGIRVVCSGGRPFNIPKVGAVATFVWNGSICKPAGGNNIEEIAY